MSIFGNGADATSHRGSFLSTVEIKYYNVMIDRKKIFNQTGKIDTNTYEKETKI